MRPQDIVEKALALLPHGGVVLVDSVASANIRFANNTLTTNGVMEQVRVTVVALFQHPTGVSAGVLTRAVVDNDALATLCAQALATAERNPPAPDADLLIPGERPTTEWSREAGATSMAEFAEFAPALKEAFSFAEAHDEVLYGFAQHQVVTTYLGTSSGLRARHQQPTSTLEMTGRGNDSSSWWGVGGERATYDPRTGANILHQRLAWAKNRIEIPAGRHRALLPPSAVADLMIYLLWSSGARDAAEGRSVFSRLHDPGKTRIGEQLSPRALTLLSDPLLSEVRCAPFVMAHASTDSQSVFDNGMPVGKTQWISDGRLTSLLGSRATERLTGIPATPAIDNLVMKVDQPDAQSIEEMVSGMPDGLLLTCLWYIREVDPMTLLLTGLTRDGVYVVKDGEIIGAASNFRFNESPVDLLSRVEKVGATERTLPREWNDWFTRTEMPPLQIPDFNFSSVSPGV
jgi:predicted Zn-dependent protease